MNNTKLLAVTGNPVLHSKSPNMFNHVFDAMQIDAAYFRLAANSASEAVATFKSLGLTGMNVTAPFKEEIIKELDWVHEDAKLIGGVNTVVCDDGILKGYNTDHFGVAQSLIDAGVVLRDTKCIVVGAGGAGRAAAFGMINKGADVTIVNRTVEKARDCAKKFGCKYASLDEITQLIDDTKVIVFSLSQNVNIIPEEYIKPHHIIFDANYKASQTAIIAKERGCTVIQGLDWLLNQAIPAFRLFFGFDPDRGAMQMGLTDNSILKRKNIISMIGFMASGKTANSHLLAEKMNISCVDTDAVISDDEQLTIPEIFATKGEEYFRELETNTLQKIIETKESQVISTGGGLVVNDNNKKLLKSKTLVVWMYASPEEIVKRLKPGKRPLLDVENPLEKAQELFALRRTHYAKIADIIINTEFGLKDKISQKIYEEINTTFND